MNTRTDPGTALCGPRKRVLVLCYSQSGQLDAVVRNMIAPLEAAADIDVRLETLTPREAFPFPWTLLRFLDAFPESVRLTPRPLQALTLRADERFDLVVLPWQVWYLAPSQPVTAFLQDPVARQILAGTPVVSLITCRNMWMKAFETFRQQMREIGARLLDNVVLCDGGPTMGTFLTTPLWLLTGRRQVLRWLPPAGLDEAEIKACGRFGHALVDALRADRERLDAPLLGGLKAVEADPHLYFSECAGTRSFRVWSRLLQACGQPGTPLRRCMLGVYLAFLIVLILSVVPLSQLLQRVFRPLFKQRLAAIKCRFESPSGASTEHLSRYEY